MGRMPAGDQDHDEVACIVRAAIVGLELHLPSVRLSFRPYAYISLGWLAGQRWYTRLAVVVGC